MTINIEALAWSNPIHLTRKRYHCGHCGADTSANVGYITLPHKELPGYQAFVGICPNCNKPSYLLYLKDALQEQIPGELLGETIDGVPEDIGKLYTEAQISAANGAHTSSVLTCRKILMHVAVSKKAEENKPFGYYVKYMAQKRYLPPEGQGWVQYIVDRANEANHEINIMEKEDSKALILLTTRMLQFVFELTSNIPSGDEDNSDNGDDSNKE